LQEADQTTGNDQISPKVLAAETAADLSAESEKKARDGAGLAEVEPTGAGPDAGEDLRAGYDEDDGRVEGKVGSEVEDGTAETGTVRALWVGKEVKE
jgi:hypothetical protein